MRRDAQIRPKSLGLLFSLLQIALVLAVTACGEGESAEPDDPIELEYGEPGACTEIQAAPSTITIYKKLDTRYSPMYWFRGALALLSEHPEPVVYSLVTEVGECKHYTLGPGGCTYEDEHGWDLLGCTEGETCSALGVCEPVPVGRFAGDMDVEVDETVTSLIWSEPQGLYYEELPPIPSDTDILVTATGGDLPAFSLLSRGTVRLDENLARDIEIDSTDDVLFTWTPDPVVPDQCVSLEIYSANEGHGLPVLDYIRCDSEDDGRLVIPDEILSSFPLWDERPNILIGHDWPPAELTRYHTSLYEDTEVQLRVESRVVFLVNP